MQVLQAGTGLVLHWHGDTLPQQDFGCGHILHGITSGQGGFSPLQGRHVYFIFGGQRRQQSSC